MIVLDPQRRYFKIEIPVSGMEKARQYRDAVLGLLGRIEIGDCEPVLKEELKLVYELLTHLENDPNKNY